MFGVTTPNVTAPFIAPVISMSEINNYSSLADSLRAGDRTSAGIILAMVDLFADDSESGSPTAPMSRKLFSRGGVVSYIAIRTAAMTSLAGDEKSDEADFMAAIQGNSDNAGAYAMNLINAAKKKALTGTNVTGFFATLGVENIRGQSIANFINKVCPFFPDKISDDAFRGLLHGSVWTTYRVSRVSSGSVILKEIAVLIAVGAVTANGAEHLAINASAASPWDISLSSQIPEKLKAYVSIYLEVAGTPIDGWYQGNRAVSEMPAARVAAVKKIFKKYLSIVNSLANLDVAVTVADLAGSANDFW